MILAWRAHAYNNYIYMYKAIIGDVKIMNPRRIISLIFGRSMSAGRFLISALLRPLDAASTLLRALSAASAVPQRNAPMGNRKNIIHDFNHRYTTQSMLQPPSFKFQVSSNNPSGERYNEKKKYRREYRQTTEILIDLRHTALTAP